MTYFEVSRECISFAKQVSSANEQDVTIVNSIDQIQIGGFDAVMCLDVLEHVPSPYDTVAQIARWLKPGGWLIAHSPFFFTSYHRVTHLKANRRFSGSYELYARYGLHPVDGRHLWNPIVLEKESTTARSAHTFRVSLGRPILLLGRQVNSLHNVIAQRMSSSNNRWSGDLARRIDSQQVFHPVALILMSAIQYSILAWFAALACMPIVVAVRFATSLLSGAAAPTPDDQLPEVLAVLSLRGGDEFLEETLKRLTSQDYPRYRLRIVIDSESDSAQTIVDDFLEQYGAKNVETMYLGQRPFSCSGKIAGLLRGTESIPAECGVVAVSDGDAVLPPSCLRELVASEQLVLKGFLVRRRTRQAGTTFRRFALSHWLLLFPALFCAKLLNLTAVLHALVAREHTWRGITYRFGAQSTIQLVDVSRANTETAVELLPDVAS
ncbi:MAG: methyltransferase domain-containing protein [Fuerstiella sp.]|nr:methyltransferase domain-containing protein [Fuerstiella sp.]MCP4858624.1 methyltransferase domain-containing protein [Fuerstiella sp.]